MAIYLDRKLKVKETLKDKIEFIPKINSKLPHVKIGILNIMPTLEDTERQFISILDNSVVQIDLNFIYLDSKHVDDEKNAYYKKYYHSFKSIKNTYYDGIIVTGAPLEHIPYPNIEYIEELKEFFKYTKTNSLSTIFLCWASQFGLQYFYGVERKVLENKLSGLYEHYVVNKTNLTNGFDDLFYIPQSRYCSIIESDITNCNDLILTSKSDISGAYIVESQDGAKVFLTGHAEYEVDTLHKEYTRDINKGLEIDPPLNYYQDNNPQNKPIFKWHSHATLLYHNWVYYYVYQKKIKKNKSDFK